LYYKILIFGKPILIMPDGKQTFQNPIVIKNYRGFVIRKYTKIQLRIGIEEAKKVIDAKLDFGMSVKDAIKRNIILCENCKGVEVVSLKK
jgi:hypothetical protein